MAVTVIERVGARRRTAATGPVAAWPWSLGGAVAAGLAWVSVPAASGDATGMLGLVRAFAVLKLAILLGLQALFVWRLRRPISRRAAHRYGVVLTIMAIAPVLAWRGTALPLAFVCFDGGLLALLVLALGDDGRGRGASAP